MSVVLVHGNPETAAVWGPLVESLEGRDVVCLSPPGFGAPVPDGFAATMDGYRDWLVAELERVSAEGAGPVDLVGHDWGGGHAVNAVLVRPDLVRSWATDVLGVFDEDYAWHDLAQAWQAPDVGEESVAKLTGGPVEAQAQRLAQRGMATAVAERVAPGIDEAMGRCTSRCTAPRPSRRWPGAERTWGGRRCAPACP